MPKLLFITKNKHGASTRYRALNYFNQLKLAGWDTRQWIAKGKLRSLPSLIRALRQADIVVIQRKLLSRYLLAVVRFFSKKLVYDFDDAIFLRDTGKPSRHRYQRFSSTIKASNIVLAGNSYLANEAKRFNQQVHVLPTTVALEKYHQQERPAGKKTIDLVWIGSNSTRKYLESIAPALEELGRRHSQLRLKIVADFDLPLCHLKTHTVQWSATDEAYQLSSSDIGLAPMIDNLWTRGKCALKVIQYMASGLAVVSSNVGTNSEVVIDHETGLLASTQDQWITAIEQLTNDDQLRYNMGSKGRQRAEAHYSQEYGFRVISTAFNQLLSCG